MVQGFCGSDMRSVLSEIPANSLMLRGSRMSSTAVGPRAFARDALVSKVGPTSRFLNCNTEFQEILNPPKRLQSIVPNPIITFLSRNTQKIWIFLTSLSQISGERLAPWRFEWWLRYVAKPNPTLDKSEGFPDLGLELFCTRKAVEEPFFFQQLHALLKRCLTPTTRNEEVSDAHNPKP